MEPTIYKPSIYKGAGIYKTVAGGGGGGELPEGYIKCNYIESRGNAYILRNFVTNASGSSCEWNIKFSPTNDTNGYYRFLATARNNNRWNNGQCIGINNQNNPAFSVAAYTVLGQISLNDRPSFVDASIKWPLNGTDRKFISNYGDLDFANGWAQTNYLWLFGFPDIPGEPSEFAMGNIYGVKFVKNDIVELDLIPVYKTDSSEYGFFEAVSKSFWGATSGTFYGG